MDIKNLTQTKRVRFPWPLRADLGMIFFGETLLLLLLLFSSESIWLLAVLRLILGAIFLLFVPGYCLSLSFFPGKDDLIAIERLTISIALSLATISVLALILHYLPWSLTFPVIVTGHTLTVLLFIGIAWWRCSRLAPTARFSPGVPVSLFQYPLATLLKRPLFWGVLGGGCFILVATTWMFQFPTSEDFLTEFYILGAEGRPENFPRDPQVGEELAVTAGVVNREQTSQTYSIEVWVTWAWDPEKWQTRVEEIDPFTLEVGEQWEQPIRWRMPWEADDALVRFLLFRQDDPEPYRELQLWMNVSDEDSSPLE